MLGRLRSDLYFHLVSPILEIDQFVMKNSLQRVKEQICIKSLLQRTFSSYLTFFFWYVCVCLYNVHISVSIESC